jgi:hypothetical protein
MAENWVSCVAQTSPKEQSVQVIVPCVDDEAEADSLQVITSDNTSTSARRDPAGQTSIQFLRNLSREKSSHTLWNSDDRANVIGIEGYSRPKF